MTKKLRQFIHRKNYTVSNRVTVACSRQFLLNQIAYHRRQRTSGAVRAGMGFLSHLMVRAYRNERRIMYRAACFLTGRRRGTSRRFSIARTQVKHLTAEGKLFGVRKSS